jgi:hypothetical protein
MQRSIIGLILALALSLSASLALARGPRSDGRIYIADYVPALQIYSCHVIGPTDSSAQVKAALNDAGLIMTTVIWPPGVIWASNVHWPAGVVMIGAGRDFNGNCGTTILGTKNLNAPVFILAKGGPFKFSQATLQAGKYAFYAPDPINGLTLESVNWGVSNPSGAGIDLESTSNYPIHISDFVASGGSYGIVAKNHMGNTIIENGKFGSQTVYPIALLNSGAGHVTSQFITIRGIDFSLNKVPDIYMEGPVGMVEIDKIETERYVTKTNFPLADIVFGPGNIGMVKVSNSVLGANTKYSIYNAPGFTLLENDGLGVPVQTTNPRNVTAISVAGPTPLVVR